MSTRSTRPRRFTILLVPEGGTGKVWQASWETEPMRRRVIAGASVAVVLLLGTLVQLWSLPRAVERDRLLAENEALRGRVGKVEADLEALEPLVQRVRAYDEQLRDLSTRQALPGFGDLAPDEAEARAAWLAGTPPPTGDNTAAFARMSHADVQAQLALDQTRVDVLGEVLDELEPRASQLEATLRTYEDASSALPILWPVEDPVLTSNFGWRKSPYSPGWRFHGGLDLAMPMGSPVVATNDGLVTFAGWDGGHGNMVVVDHGHGVSTRYCHASRLLVAAGDQVKAGDLVALVGSTGVSTGPHLHYELFFDGEKVDPLPYLP